MVIGNASWNSFTINYFLNLNSQTFRIFSILQQYMNIVPYTYVVGLSKPTWRAQFALGIMSTSVLMCPLHPSRRTQKNPWSHLGLPHYNWWLKLDFNHLSCGDQKHLIIKSSVIENFQSPPFWCVTVALPFTWKNILTRYHNSITNPKLHKPKYHLSKILM